jgi:hypothetical protein
MTCRAIRLQSRNLVFVVDDDPAILRSVARLLRQFGYASLLFPSAEAFANHSDFGNALCVPSRHQPGRWVRHRATAPSQSDEHFCASHLHDWKRQPRRSRDCASIRMPRLSHKAVLGEVADGAARESVGFLTLPTIDCRFSLAGDPARIFVLPGEAFG